MNTKKILIAILVCLLSFILFSFVVKVNAATISEDGKAGLVTAATAIALIGLDLITEPEKLEKVKKEFKEGTC